MRALREFSIGHKTTLTSIPFTALERQCIPLRDRKYRMASLDAHPKLHDRHSIHVMKLHGATCLDDNDDDGDCRKDIRR